MKVPEPKKLESGTWFIQLRLGGESVYITGTTATECKRTAAATKAAYRADSSIKRNNKTNITLEQAIDNYIANRSNTLSPSTLRGYTAIKRNRFKSVMKATLKRDTDWQAICNEEAKFISPKTLGNAWGLVSTVLNENGIATPKIKMPQKTKKETVWLTPEEIKIFIEAVKGDECEIVSLLELHSLRYSEASALTWEKHIDLKNKTIKVDGAKIRGVDHKPVLTHNNKTIASKRTIPIMIPELYDALCAVENKSGYVITKPQQTLLVHIKKVCQKANITETTHHGLRHSFASLCYHLEVPEKITMRLGGWSDYATVMKIYTHLSNKDIQKHTQNISGFFENAM